MKTKLLSLFVALIATTALWASNTITYTATEQLQGVFSRRDSGLHYQAFDVEITSHTFSNGVGTIIFADEVTTIGNHAFYGCSGLTSITIPNSVTTIESAFTLCDGLKGVYITDLAAWCKISFSSYSGSNPLECAHNLYLNNQLVTDLVIPNSVTTIGKSAFLDCSGLTSVTIGNSVTTIGENAFSSCTGLTSITIPNSVTTIESSAFSRCTGLTSVTIPNSVTEIGYGVFENCSSLISVKIPNSVTTIGENAFSGCSGLTSIEIPNSVTTIGDHAFKDCSNLSYINFGGGLQSIGDLAFAGCKIDTAVIYATTPPSCVQTTGWSGTFYGLSRYAYLLVPQDCERAYKLADGWNSFDIHVQEANIVPTENKVIVSTSDQNVTITWPINDNASAYTLIITKSGETVCTLTFNAQGQLLNIAFAAPGHNGAHQAPAATLTAQGYQFTVTGLNPGTAYDYSVTATDAGGETLAEHKGNFSTTGGESSLESVHGSQPTMHKYFHNGNLIIERNGVKYTPTGQKVR